MLDEKNKLYYGDNLQVLRDYIADASVDLVYLDPPFNSRQDYNVLFAEKDGNRSAAQITAFKDTWEWNLESQAAYEEIVERGGRVADAMHAFKTLLGNTDMMAYLAMMAPRLVELRRVLKDTGSIYLHCDPTASHYLKLIMDAVFGPQLFKNEIIWKRSDAHSDGKQGATHLGRVHDVILFFFREEIIRNSKRCILRFQIQLRKSGIDISKRERADDTTRLTLPDQAVPQKATHSMSGKGSHVIGDIRSRGWKRWRRKADSYIRRVAWFTRSDI